MKEPQIVYDRREDPTDKKRWVATVLVHELAHQWFGNLVTAEYWDQCVH